MILQALVDYYEALAKRGDISPLGWCVERVSFSLNLSSDGRLLGVIPQMHNRQMGKKEVSVPDTMQVPERVIRSSGIKANFLCDNTSYILGFDQKGKPQRSRDCFRAAKQLHLKVLADCHGQAAAAVKGFFTHWQPETATAHPTLQPYLEAMATANLVFRVEGGGCAQEDDEIRRAWQSHYRQSSEGPHLRCLATGKTEPVAPLHGKIKGVPGAQSAGANLVSFNAPAYESYGQGEASSPNAPVSEYAAFAYVTALNQLLANRERRYQIGDATVVFWAENADPRPPQIFADLLTPEPDTESRVAGILHNLSRGLPVDEVDLTKRFFVLGLAPNAARISVRFFLQNSFGDMLEKLKLHYEQLDIERPSFDQRQYLSPSALLAETVNPNSQDKAASPLLSGAVMRSILTGARYPEALLSSVMGRIRAEQNISRGKAAIIKACLLRNYNDMKEVVTVPLNKGCNDRAYVLGRLFAVLEDIQRGANPNLNRTIKDKYLTSACTTPGSVFPLLLKLSSYHITKSRHYHKEREKAELLNRLEVTQNPLPAHHTPKEQGLFMLGYYQQMQASFKRSNTKEEKPDDSNQ